MQSPREGWLSGCRPSLLGGLQAPWTSRAAAAGASWDGPCTASRPPRGQALHLHLAWPGTAWAGDSPAGVRGSQAMGLAQCDSGGPLGLAGTGLPGSLRGPWGASALTQRQPHRPGSSLGGLEPAASNSSPLGWRGLGALAGTWEGCCVPGLRWHRSRYLKPSRPASPYPQVSSRPCSRGAARFW